MDLAIAAIVKEENLEVTDEEVEAEFAEMAGKYGMDAETLKKYTPADAIREQLLRNKAVAVVADSAVAVKPEVKEDEGEEKPKRKRTKKSGEEAGEASEESAE